MMGEQPMLIKPFCPRKRAARFSRGTGISIGADASTHVVVVFAADRLLGACGARGRTEDGDRAAIDANHGGHALGDDTKCLQELCSPGRVGLSAEKQ